MSSLTLSYTFGSDTQGWTWIQTTASAPSPSNGWDSTDGDPAGCLSVSESGSSLSDVAGYWSLSGTWESFGIPSGSTITGIQLSSVDESASVASGAAATAGPYTLSGSTSGDLTLLSSLGFSSTTSWASRSGTSQSVPSDIQPSGSTVTFELGTSIGGPGAFGTVSLYQDNVSLVITYTAGSGTTMADSASIGPDSTVTATGVMTLDGSASIILGSTVTAILADVSPAATIASGSNLSPSGVLLLGGHTVVAPGSSMPATPTISWGGSSTIAPESSLLARLGEPISVVISFESDGIVSANGGLLLPGIASLESDSSIIAFADYLDATSAWIKPDNSVSATPTMTWGGSATIAADSQVTVLGGALLSGAAAINPGSSMAGFAGYFQSGASNIDSDSSLLANGGVGEVDGASIAIGSSITVNGGFKLPGSASIVGGSTLAGLCVLGSGTPVVIRPGSTLTANGGLDLAGMASIAPASSAAARGGMNRGVAASIASASSLGAKGGLRLPGSAQLSSSSSISTDGKLNKYLATSINGSGSLSAAPLIAYRVSARPKDDSTLTATGGLLKAASGQVKGSSILRTMGVLTQTDSSTITGGSTLIGKGGLVLKTASTLSSDSTLTATPSSVHYETIPPTYYDVEAAIMTSMMNYLVSQKVFTQDQVSLSLWNPPPMAVPAMAFAQIEPRGGMSMDGLVEGSGRNDSAISTLVGVNVYVQNARDSMYADTLRLVDEGALYPTIEAVVNALQLWLPVDTWGRALAIEPMRLVRITSPQNYSTSREWVFAAVIFEINYRAALKACA